MSTKAERRWKKFVTRERLKRRRSLPGVDRLALWIFGVSFSEAERSFLAQNNVPLTDEVRQAAARRMIEKSRLA